jgi:hypothetical protein
MDRIAKNRPLFYLLVWGGLLVTLLGFGGMVALQLSGCQNLFNPIAPEPAQAYGWIAVPFMAMGFAMLGTLVSLFRPENRIGWLALAMGMLAMFYFLSIQYTACATQNIISPPDNLIVYWLSNPLEWSMSLIISLFVWLFPNGRFLSRRWRQLAWLMMGLLLLFGLLTFFWPSSLWRWSSMDLPSDLQNPLGLPFRPSPFWETVVFAGRSLLMNSFILLGFLGLGFRWRYTQGDERQQIKWLALFVVVFGTMFMSVEIMGVAFYPAIFEGWFYFFVVTSFFFGFPIVFGMSIFKYRLYDIDIIIRRTVQYGVVSAVLVAVYFGSITLIQGGLTAVTNTQSPLAIVLSTLLIAALFNPLRRRVQTAVDRRFYRKKYDAQQVLAQFAVVARDETEIEALTAELIRVVQETMQPNRISLWLKDDVS